MIENEIKALRIAIEEHGNLFVETISRFADAVNTFSEKVDILIEQGGTTPPVIAPVHEEKAEPESPAYDPMADTEEEEEAKPEPKPKKKKAAKKKAVTKKPDETLTVSDVRKHLVAAVSAGMGAEVQKATKEIMQGMNLSDLEDNDPKLFKLRDAIKAMQDA